ncbi:MAG: serine protease Do [Acidobacteriaceae bacterium]|jgi:serine protease Do
MRPNKWFTKAVKTSTVRFLTVGVLALLAVFAGYEGMAPPVAKAAMVSPAPAAAALDDNSVGTLLALDKAMETLAARVTPAIVNVAVTSKTAMEANGQERDDSQQFFGQFFGHGLQPPQPQIQHGIGSGVLVSPDGYIVTNDHVVDGAVDIRVTMSNRKILKAKLIGTDKLTDLAVIKVEGSNFPSVPWGNSTELHPGQTVLAFGNPFGFRFTVTRGIVSALNRPNPYSTDPRRPGGFIQTDAAINQGNSGGPLVDARGEVIGINTFLISPSGAFSGMGFAIPSQLVRPTVESLIRDGKVSHGYMGIGISDVTPENAKFFQLNDNTGAVVTQVEPASPGAKAGLRVGDVITDVDGRQVSDASNLQLEVGQKRPGSKLNLQVMRDGKRMTLPITLEEMGSRDSEGNHSVDAQPGKARWGLGITDITPDIREQAHTPENVKGAIVERVQPGSPADNAGLQPGDVIQEVNRHRVDNASDAKRALSTVATGQDAMVLVWSNGGNSFRVLHAGEGS